MERSLHYAGATHVLTGVLANLKESSHKFAVVFVNVMHF